MTKSRPKQHPLPMHVLEVVAKRSGGNPQFLRDLLRAAIQSGGIGGLPDSAEAATMARIDALAPEDRALVRRAAVFGLTFHPRMLAWLDDEATAAATGSATGRGSPTSSSEEADGYLRFRRSLLRDAAYEGLPLQAAPATARRGRCAHGAGDGCSRRRRRTSSRCTTSLPASIAPAWRYARSPPSTRRAPLRTSKRRACSRAR